MNNKNKSNNESHWQKKGRGNFSSHKKSFRGHRNSSNNFIPHIFKENLSKPPLVNADDPFITNHSAKEYCSLLSLEENGLPLYLEHFKEFTDNVLDIPEQVFDDIAKVHIERENKFKEEEEEEERRSAHQHAIELKEKNSMDKEVAKILNAPKYYVKRFCPVKIPFKSTLTHEEHEFYIKCFIKFQIRAPVNALEKKEYDQYLSLQNRVFNEQSCMMNFSLKVSQLVLNEYNQVPVVIDNYIKEYVSHRCQRAWSYPSYYKSEIEIPLKAQNLEASSANNFQFTHLGHLLSMGNIPWIYLPKPFLKTTLPQDESVGLKRRPDCDENFDKSCYLYKCPISEDPNAEYLAKLHHASVVITPSAFKVIMNNQEQPFDKEWNIPVKIKTHKVKDENGKESEMRIIFIDKPLPRKTWLPLQKKFTFFKNSAKATFSNHFKFNNINYYRIKAPTQTKGYSSQRSQKTSFGGNLFGHRSGNEKRSKRNSFEDNLCSGTSVDEKRSIRTSFEDDPFGGMSGDESVESFGEGSSHIFSSRSFKSKSSKEKKETFSDELASDLFLSEDEEDGGNGVDKNRNQEGTASVPLPYSSHTEAVNLSSDKNVGEHSRSQSNANSSSGGEPVLHPSSSFTNRGGASIPPPSSYASNKRPYSKEFGSSTESREQGFHTPKKAKWSHTGTGLLDDILDKQDSFLKLKTSPSSSKAPPNAVSSILNSFDSSNRYAKNVVVLKPWSDTISSEWNENFEIKECPPSGDTNVHYQLFSFENLKQCPVKEECQKPVKVLVRHNVHGVSKFPKQHPSLAKAYMLFPKIENQVYFGAEVNSLSEIIQQWSDMLLRPNTHLLQVRICAESGDVLMTEEKTLETILKEGKQQHLNFNPQVTFSSFNLLVNTLMKMSSGDYLLHHSPKTEAFMTLMKASNSNEYVFSSSMELHKFYSDGSLTSKLYRTSPWLNIDTHVITPFHAAHNKIPATFPMKNDKKLSKKDRERIKSKCKKKQSLEGYG